MFDVYGYMKKMRQQRRGLVETLVSVYWTCDALFRFVEFFGRNVKLFDLQDQYRFVYETLMEYTRGIDSRFPVSELANKIKERGIKDKKTKKNAYQMEYSVT